MSGNNNKSKHSDLPLVPESVLRKRHDLDDLARKRAASVATEKKQRKLHGKKAFYVKKPETFLVQAKSRRNHERRYKRVMHKGMQTRASNKPVKAVQEVVDPDNGETKHVTYQSNSVGANVVFVIRIRNSVGEPRVVKQALNALRLQKIHEGVFVEYSQENRKLLHLVEPWVVYGKPSQAVVNDLIARRGFGRLQGRRVPLSDNVTIEKALGQHNIICVEDLVHEIYHTGPAFAVASTFLRPFLLTDSKTEFERRVLKLKDGKDYGDKGETINDYIKQVL